MFTLFPGPEGPRDRPLGGTHSTTTSRLPVPFAAGPGSKKSWWKVLATGGTDPFWHRSKILPGSSWCPAGGGTGYLFLSHKVVGEILGVTNTVGQWPEDMAGTLSWLEQWNNKDFKSVWDIMRVPSSVLRFLRTEVVFVLKKEQFLCLLIFSR